MTSHCLNFTVQTEIKHKTINSGSNCFRVDYSFKRCLLPLIHKYFFDLTYLLITVSQKVTEKRHMTCLIATAAVRASAFLFIVQLNS